MWTNCTKITISHHMCLCLGKLLFQIDSKITICCWTLLTSSGFRVDVAGFWIADDEGTSPNRPNLEDSSSWAAKGSVLESSLPVKSPKIDDPWPSALPALSPHKLNKPFELGSQRPFAWNYNSFKWSTTFLTQTCVTFSKILNPTTATGVRRVSIYKSPSLKTY